VDRDLLIQDSARTHADVRGDAACLSVIALGLACRAGQPLRSSRYSLPTLVDFAGMWLTKLASPASRS